MSGLQYFGAPAASQGAGAGAGVTQSTPGTVVEQTIGYLDNLPFQVVKFDQGGIPALAFMVEGDTTPRLVITSDGTLLFNDGIADIWSWLAGLQVKTGWATDDAEEQTPLGLELIGNLYTGSNAGYIALEGWLGLELGQSNSLQLFQLNDPDTKITTLHGSQLRAWNTEALGLADGIAGTLEWTSLIEDMPQLGQLINEPEEGSYSSSAFALEAPGVYSIIVKADVTDGTPTTLDLVTQFQDPFLQLSESLSLLDGALVEFKYFKTAGAGTPLQLQVTQTGEAGTVDVTAEIYIAKIA